MKLTDKTFIIFAMKHYDNPACASVEEFNQDIATISFIKKLFKRHENGGEIRERQILNYIICLSNVFGVIPTTRMLFFKIKKEQHPYLKPFLEYLGFLPDAHYSFLKLDGINIHRITSNEHIKKKLESL